MNDTWGFKKDDQNWKSVPVLVKQLVRIASHGGNYLLNVGPTSEGLIPQPSVERLHAVGKWLRVNSEAINGTSPSPFPYDQDWGLITARSGKLYLHVFDWPGKALTIYGIKSKVRKAYLLSDPSRKALSVSQKSDAPIEFYSASIQLPTVAPDPYNSVIVIEAGADVVTALTQQPSGTVSLITQLAEMHKASADSSLSLDTRGVASGWSNPKDWLSWDFKVFHPGTFEVTALTAAPRRNGAWEGGHKVTLDVAGKQLHATLSDDGQLLDPSDPRMKMVVSKLGRVAIDKAGSYKLALKPESIESRRKSGLGLVTVKLTPAR
jgi:alpha-L-fucosidase